MRAYKWDQMGRKKIKIEENCVKWSKRKGKDASTRQAQIHEEDK